MKKKIVALSLCVAMLAIAVIGGTLAYFTDKDQVNNTFTIGNIDIDLYEYTGEEEEGQNGEKVPVKNQTGKDYTKVMPGDTLVKKPVIENTGSNTAYVRVAVVMNNLVEINNAIDGVYEGKDGYGDAAIQNIYNKIFKGWGINYIRRPGYPNSRRMWMMERMILGIDMYGRVDSGDADYGMFDIKNMFQSDDEKANAAGIKDGIVYEYNGEKSYYSKAVNQNERVYVFYMKLGAGEDSTLFDGLNVPAEFTNEQMKMFDGLEINIYADAIQADHFNDTTDADNNVTPAYVHAFNALEKAHPLGWWNE